MGTRTLVHIKDGKSTIATIYRQYDGYPTGMGNDIKTILNNGNVQIKNGFSMGDEIPNKFNGMGCLASYLIGELKGGKIGNVYLLPVNSSDAGEDYTYTISLDKNNKVKLKVVENYKDKTIFNGLLSEFDGDEVEKLNRENDDE